ESDEEAHAAALRSEAPYVAIVASPRRAGRVREYLEAEGLSCCQIGKLHAPAGLDLGAQSAEDIALSIMAQIVQERARDASSTRIPTMASVPAAAAAPSAKAAAMPVRKGAALPIIQPATAVERAETIEAVDPVCQMRVPVLAAGGGVTAEHEGIVYHFCCPGCRRRFLQAPEAFVSKTA
ncbi:MAG: XdhC family protein, partial [Thermomicrobiales bacterium]